MLGIEAFERTDRIEAGRLSNQRIPTIVDISYGRIRVDIIFWQNIRSIHQAEFINAVAELHDGEVTWVTEKELPERRRKMGWHSPDECRMQQVVAPGQSEVQEILREQDRSAVHVLSGFTHRFVVGVLDRVDEANDIVLMAEPGKCWPKSHGTIRWLRDRFKRKPWKDQVRAILAIGRHGPRWYRSLGFAEEKLFPFGYFIGRAKQSDFEKEIYGGTEKKGFRMVFVGQHIRRKGGGMLIEALAQISGYLDFEIDFVGDGPKRKEWKNETEKRGIGDEFRFLGNIPNRQLKKKLSRYDLLVLPSRWDGWGVVVNEALMVGTPVVCSSNCGAADLIRSPQHGRIFDADNISALASALAIQIDQGPVRKAQRNRLKQWSELIHPKAGARYFLKIMDYLYTPDVKRLPRAPWLRN